MRVCLINPILFSFQRVRGRSLKNNISMSFYPPLGLCYIANILEKNGIDVKIIDRNPLMTMHNCNQSVVDNIMDIELRKFKPDIVGITITTPTLFDARNNIIRVIRKIDERIPIIFGGPHASALPEDTLQTNRDIDIVCRGEGEMTMLEIAQGKKLENIIGISYRDGEKIISNIDRKPHDKIDDFCFPARHLVDMQFYCRENPYIMHGLYLRSTTMFTSRGCAYNCNFCAGRTALGKGVRFQAPDLVIEEIDKLIRDYKIEGIYFADDMFDIDKNRARSICQKLIDKKFHKKICWNAQLRANSMDRDLLKLMKKAGCIRVDVGFESGSQKTLNTINKKTTVTQNYEAAKMLHEFGIQIHANIIVGLPGENLEDLNKTKTFMKKIKPHWIGFGEFIPLPGSKLFNELVDRGELTKERVIMLGSFNFTKLDHKTFNRFIKNVRNKIVIPTRIKSYIIYNRKKPAAYFYMIKLIIAVIGDTFKSMVKSFQLI